MAELLAAPPGFEPGFRVPKTLVLPLDDGAKCWRKITYLFNLLNGGIITLNFKFVNTSENVPQKGDEDCAG